MYSTHLGTYMAHINLYFCCLKDIYLPINFPFDDRFDLILDLMSADFDVVAPTFKYKTQPVAILLNTPWLLTTTLGIKLTGK